MFHFVSRNLSSQLKNRSIRDFDFISNPILLRRSFSVKPKSESSSFVVSYLINTCGLSPQVATSVSKKINFKSTIKPDANIKFFKDYGFGQSNLSKIIKNRPNLLLAAKDEILEPKLEFLEQNGFSGPQIVKFISSNPSFLYCSLENKLIPFFDYLKSLLGTDEHVASIIRKNIWIINANYQEVIVPKIEVLRNIGMPESIISKTIKRKPRLLSAKNSLFKEIVREVDELGFNPSSTMFVEAVNLKIGLSKATWEKKMEAFRSYGFTENEIICLFRKFPESMSVSEKKLCNGLHFLINIMDVKPSFIVKYGVSLTYSLEKRIIPRWTVLQGLFSKGLLVEKKASVCNSLKLTNSAFMEMYLTKYETEAPELCKLYQAKL